MFFEPRFEFVGGGVDDDGDGGEEFGLHEDVVSAGDSIDEFADGGVCGLITDDEIDGLACDGEAFGAVFFEFFFEDFLKKLHMIQNFLR